MCVFVQHVPLVLWLKVSDSVDFVPSVSLTCNVWKLCLHMQSQNVVCVVKRCFTQVWLEVEIPLIPTSIKAICYTHCLNAYKNTGLANNTQPSACYLFRILHRWKHPVWVPAVSLPVAVVCVLPGGVWGEDGLHGLGPAVSHSGQGPVDTHGYERA